MPLNRPTSARYADGSDRATPPPSSPFRGPLSSASNPAHYAPATSGTNATDHRSSLAGGRAAEQHTRTSTDTPTISRSSTSSLARASNDGNDGAGSRKRARVDRSSAEDHADDTGGGGDGRPTAHGWSSTHPHVCEICDRAFTRREHLKRHRAAHDGSYFVACEICGATFSRQDALKRHMALHGDRVVQAGLSQDTSDPQNSSASSAWDGGIFSGSFSARSRAAITKTRKACTNCKKHKIKCDGQEVCRNCLSRPGSTCEYPLKRGLAQVDTRRASTDQDLHGGASFSDAGDVSQEGKSQSSQYMNGSAAGGSGASHAASRRFNQETPAPPSIRGEGSDTLRSAGHLGSSNGSSAPVAAPSRSSANASMAYNVNYQVPPTQQQPQQPQQQQPQQQDYHGQQTSISPPSTSSPGYFRGYSFSGSVRDPISQSYVGGSVQAARPPATQWLNSHGQLLSSAPTAPAVTIVDVPATNQAYSSPSWTAEQGAQAPDWLDAAFSDSSMLIADQTFDWLFAPLPDGLAQTSEPSDLGSAMGFATSPGWSVPGTANNTAAAISLGASSYHDAQSTWPEMARMPRNGQTAGAAGLSNGTSGPGQTPVSCSSPADSSPRNDDTVGDADPKSRHSRRPRQRESTSYSLSKSGIQSSSADDEVGQVELGSRLVARSRQEHAAQAGKGADWRGSAMQSAAVGQTALADGWWRHPAYSALHCSTEPIGEATQQDILAEDTMQVARFSEYAKTKLLSLIKLAELSKADDKRAHDMLKAVSVDTYNVFMQLYFERFHPQYPFLHMPTFSADKCNVFLLAGVIAHGSLSSRIPRASDLGNVLAEIANKAQFTAWHRTNLRERSLAFVQSMMLYCIFMRSTGNRRLLEFAEAIRSPLTTMTRRRRLLDKAPPLSTLGDASAASASSTSSSRSAPNGPGKQQDDGAGGTGRGVTSARTSPPANWNSQQQQAQASNGSRDSVATPASLHARWQAWIHAESAKRTGWAVFVSDVELSVSWNLPASFSLDELKAELPCSDASWNAPNATMWNMAARGDQRVQPSSAELGYYTVADFHTALEEGTATTLLTDEIKASDFQRAVLANSLSSLSDAMSTVSKSCLRMHSREVAETFRSLCVNLAEQQAAVLERYSGLPRAPPSASLASPKLELAVRFDLLRTIVDLHDLQILGGRHCPEEKVETLRRIAGRFDRDPWEPWSLGVHAGRIVYFFRTYPASSTFEGLLFFYAAISLHLVSLWWKDKGDITVGQLTDPASVQRPRRDGFSPSFGRGRAWSSISESKDSQTGFEVLSVHLDGPSYVPISLMIGDPSRAQRDRSGTSSSTSGSREESSASSFETLAAAAESSRAAAKVVRPKLSFIGELASPLAPRRILSNYSEQLQQRVASRGWPICEPLAVILSEMLESAELLEEPLHQTSHQQTQRQQ